MAAPGTSVDDDDGESPVVGKADLGLDDGDGIVDGFDGVETSDDNDGGDSDDSGGGGGGPTPDGDIEISTAIESGLAEAAAVGLQGRERERVSTEMQAVAEKFHVGYFGEQCVEKYLRRDLSDIPPEYGLAAALVAFSAIAIYKRPDGEEQVQNAVSIVREKLFGEDDDAPPEDVRPEPEPEPEPGQPTPAEQIQQSGQQPPPADLGGPTPAPGAAQQPPGTQQDFSPDDPQPTVTFDGVDEGGAPTSATQDEVDEAFDDQAEGEGEGEERSEEKQIPDTVPQDNE